MSFTFCLKFELKSKVHSAEFELEAMNSRVY